MGLDSVELLMAFEESFGVNLADGKAAKVVTPGMVSDLICAKLKLTDEKTCQTQRAFYLLRRALVKGFQKQRDEIVPNTPMRLLFPASDCTSWWGDLKKSVDARSWPLLTRPRWMVQGISWVSLLTLVFVTVRVYDGTDFQGAFVAIGIGFVVAILVLAALALATRPFARALPARIRLVKDLVPFAATSNSICWTREEIAATVKEIVMEQLGLKESQYSENANFVNDLGME